MTSRRPSRVPVRSKPVPATATTRLLQKSTAAWYADWKARQAGAAAAPAADAR